MKKLSLIIVLSASVSCTAQTYPLRTFSEIPENAYLKDTNNELPAYEGTWKGTWDNKTIYVTFNKIINRYNENLKYYKDYLIGRFKILNSNGTILFDNTNLSDDNTKIKGSGVRKLDDKYSLIYIDKDLCGTTGSIYINFTDNSKAKLNWKYLRDSNFISTDCPYYSTGIPDTLPKNIILTKQ